MIDDSKMHLKHGFNVEIVKNIANIASGVAIARDYKESITKNSQVYKDVLRIVNLPQQEQMKEVLKIELIGKTKEQVEQKLFETKMLELKTFNNP
jgi:hypothetical protein